ncbi:helix-turn-helix domain-containing protein [Oleiharenicola lentus]
MNAPAPLPNGDTLLRIKEAAACLRSCDKTVRRLITEGKLPSIKIRGLRLIRASDLTKLTQPPTP